MTNLILNIYIFLALQLFSHSSHTVELLLPAPILHIPSPFMHQRKSLTELQPQSLPAESSISASLATNLLKMRLSVNITTQSGTGKSCKLNRLY